MSLLPTATHSYSALSRASPWPPHQGLSSWKMQLPEAPRARPASHSTMAKKEMEVMKGLDLKRYMGRWYEIASLPSRFQPKDAINSRATYTLSPDGTLHALNETWSDGKRGSIEGTAYEANPSSDEAKFRVKFYVPPFLPIFPVTADYWVLSIDDDYQYALIGHPTRRYLHIVSRQNQLDEEIYNQLVQKAKDEGYDVSKLKKTQQTLPPPESDDAPKDAIGVWWIKAILAK